MMIWDAVLAIAATTYLVLAFEEFIVSIGRWKALAMPVIVGGLLYLLGYTEPRSLIIESVACSLAATWLLSTITAPDVSVQQVNRGVRLPNRVPPL